MRNWAEKEVPEIQGKLQTEFFAEETVSFSSSFENFSIQDMHGGGLLATLLVRPGAPLVASFAPSSDALCS